MNAQMNFVEMAEYGSAEVLQTKVGALPTMIPGGLLIRTEAVGVNYSDILRRQDRYFRPTPLPYILGSEVVGQVVARGEGISDEAFPEEKRVLAILPGGGAYADYVMAPAQYCVPLPPHIAAADATALFVQGSTAHLMLTRVLKSIEGKTLLVHGAAGGVGSLLVQLGKLMGAELIAAASTEEKLQFARELGADQVINYSRPQWTDELLAQRNGEPVDYILEMVGGDIYRQSFACLKDGGSMVVYGSASQKPGMIHSEHLVDHNHQLLSFNLAHFIQHRTAEWQASLGAMIGFLAEGKIQIKTSHQYPLSEAAQAHRDIESRCTQGKVVLIP